MLLAISPSFELVKFIQVLCWIILPFTLLVVILTVFLHYRKKRSGSTGNATTDEKLMLASPEQLGYTRGDGEYIFFDHSALIGEYKKRLSYNHARYTALRHDYEKLEVKYTGLASYATSKFINHNTIDMENTYEQMPKAMQEEIEKLSGEFKAEKEELLVRLEQMNQTYQSLEEENRSLQDQINLQTASEEEKVIILHRWKEENKSLQEKVAEQQYLHDVLSEKKVQIEFLQNQLEQRIRIQHLTEQQRVQILGELEEAKKVHVNELHQIDKLKNELLLKQEDADKLQMVLCGKEEQLSERQQLLASKLDHITWLESTLHESKEQNEFLNASVADGKDLIAALQEQLTHEQLRAESIEQKLSSNKQLLQRLYKDFSAVMDKENERSPVITLRPDYVNKENTEIAAQ